MRLIDRLQQDVSIGARVMVSAKCAGWQSDFHGLICSTPEPVDTRRGLDYVYWVQFDSPQHDLSEDGPYFKAQILGRCLTPAA